MTKLRTFKDTKSAQTYAKNISTSQYEIVSINNQKTILISSNEYQNKLTESFFITLTKFDQKFQDVLPTLTSDLLLMTKKLRSFFFYLLEHYKAISFLSPTIIDTEETFDAYPMMHMSEVYPNFEKHHLLLNFHKELQAHLQSMKSDRYRRIVINNKEYILCKHQDVYLKDITRGLTTAVEQFFDQFPEVKTSNELIVPLLTEAIFTYINKHHHVQFIDMDSQEQTKKKGMK